MEEWDVRVHTRVAVVGKREILFLFWIAACVFFLNVLLQINNEKRFREEEEIGPLRCIFHKY